MDKLIRDLERATESSQYSLLREAVALVHSHARLVLLLRAIDFAEQNRMPELLIGVALSLVPEGWTWGVSEHPPNEVFNPGGGQGYVTQQPNADGYEHSDAKTPALALTIAALKARLKEGRHDS